jgi:hypothetical protein
MSFIKMVIKHKMDFNSLSYDIIETIAKCVDLPSYPYFKSCCKNINTIATNDIYKLKLTKSIEEKLLKIIEIVTEYHLHLSNRKVKSSIVKVILKDLCLRFKRKPQKPILRETMSEMFDFVIAKTNCSSAEACYVLKEYITGGSLDDERYKDIVTAYEDYTFTQRYSVGFDSSDRSGKLKYYTDIRIDFQDDGHPLLYFSILDMKNIKDLKTLEKKHINDILMQIPDAKYHKGLISFKISNQSISVLSKVIIDAMGLDIYVFKSLRIQDFQFYCRLWESLHYKCIHQEVNKHINPVSYRTKMMDVLDKLD